MARAAALALLLVAGGLPPGAPAQSGISDEELVKKMSEVVDGMGGAPAPAAPRVATVAPDREAVMVALAESMGYGGDTAVDDLRNTLGSINNDMESLPAELLADSFARSIAGALQLGLTHSAAQELHPYDDIIVHAVGAAEGREGAALTHMAKYLGTVDFGESSTKIVRNHVRIVLIGPDASAQAIPTAT